MLERFSAEFKRYFTLSSAASGGLTYQTLFSIGSALNRDSIFSRGTVNTTINTVKRGAHKLMTSTIREVVSEIIPRRIYLSNLPKSIPFSDLAQDEKESDARSALLVSCMEFRELAESKADLLLEPDSKKIKYHVLAMQDVTALVDTDDLIYDVLQLMLAFAAQKKPIHVHCYSGVGRSAMITAVHIAHLYMLGDVDIKAIIDKNSPLDAASETFIDDLYQRVTDYVYSKRNCCEFDSDDRNGRALRVLKELYAQIYSGKKIEPHAEAYQWLATLVQSAEYKKLLHHFYNSPLFHLMPSSSTEAAVDLKKIIEQFLNTLLINQSGWYENLVNAVNAKKLAEGESNPLIQFCYVNGAIAAEKKQGPAIEERRQLLAGLLTRVDQLAIQFPLALHSKQAIQYKNNQQVDALASSVKDIVIEEQPPSGRFSPSRP